MVAIARIVLTVLNRMILKVTFIRTYSPGDPGEETDSHRNGFGEDSSPSSCSDMPLHQFVCVYHPESSGPGNEFGDVCKTGRC